MAISESVGGLWRKNSGNPILQSCNGLFGLGHHSLFRDAFGKLKIVFHAHQSENQIHPRYMVIADVTIENGQMSISHDFIIPELE